MSFIVKDRNSKKGSRDGKKFSDYISEIYPEFGYGNLNFYLNIIPKEIQKQQSLEIHKRKRKVTVQSHRGNFQEKVKKDDNYEWDLENIRYTASIIFLRGFIPPNFSRIFLRTIFSDKLILFLRLQLDVIAVHFNIRQQSEWYNITLEQMASVAGTNFSTNFHGDVAKVFAEAYPQFKWESYMFSRSINFFYLILWTPTYFSFFSSTFLKSCVSKTKIFIFIWFELFTLFYKSFLTISHPFFFFSSSIFIFRSELSLEFSL